MISLSNQRPGSAGSESADLSSGAGARLDDLVATAAVVVVGATLATRIQRRVRKQNPHPGERRGLLYERLRQIEAAKRAGAQAWHKAAREEAAGRDGAMVDAEPATRPVEMAGQKT